MTEYVGGHRTAYPDGHCPSERPHVAATNNADATTSRDAPQPPTRAEYANNATDRPANTFALDMGHRGYPRLMSDKYDPDERFSLYPLTAEEVVKRLADEDQPHIEQADDTEPDDS